MTKILMDTQKISLPIVHPEKKFEKTFVSPMLSNAITTKQMNAYPETMSRILARTSYNPKGRNKSRNKNTNRLKARHTRHHLAVEILTGYGNVRIFLTYIWLPSKSTNIAHDILNDS
jgi:hypothetical protein